MNVSKLYLTFLGMFSFAVSSAFRAQGSVYQSSFGVGPVTNFPGANFSIGASTGPNGGGDGAGLLLFADTHLVLRPVTYTAGIGHVWYRTLDGTVIDPSFVAANSPFASSITGNLSGQIHMTLGGSFLMGFWLDANTNNTPDPGDRFGWARLRYTTANGLTLLDNAIEDTGAGIIAGTTNPVPEPSASVLLALSLGLSLARRAPRKG